MNTIIHAANLTVPLYSYGFDSDESAVQAV